MCMCLYVGTDLGKIQSGEGYFKNNTTKYAYTLQTSIHTIHSIPYSTLILAIHSLFFSTSHNQTTSRAIWYIYCIRKNKLCSKATNKIKIKSEVKTTVVVKENKGQQQEEKKYSLVNMQKYLQIKAIKAILN